MNVAARTPGKNAFVEMPNGLFTASGYWFHTSEQALRKYAPALLEHVSVEQLLRQAERWLRSPQTLAVWMLPVLLVWLSPISALLAAFGLFAVWTLLRPLFVSWRAATFFGVLEHVGLQALYIIGTLSWLGMQGHTAALIVGLVGFVALRWGLVEKGLGYLLNPLLVKLYPLPVPDHVLKSVMVRKSIKLRVSLDDVDRMQRVLLDTVLQKTKKRRTKK